MITFNQLAVTLDPGVRVEIDTSQSVRGLPGQPYRILVLGQRLAGGTVLAEALQLITRDTEPDMFWKPGSQIARLFAKARANNRSTEMYGLALDDDGAGVQATGSVTLGGATGGGVLPFYVAGERVQTSVSSDLQASALALAAAINADDSLPITAAQNPGLLEQVVFTAKNAGEAGNLIDLRDSYYAGEALPDGLTLTYVAMNGGAGDPDVSLAIAALPADLSFNVVIMPWTGAANMAALEAELDDRWNANRALDGESFSGLSGTVGTLVTAVSGLDSPFQNSVGIKGSPTPVTEVAAAIAGAAADSAKRDPGRGLHGVVLKGVLAPAPADQFTSEERDLLMAAGIATTRATESGEVMINRMVTHYTADASLRDLSSIFLHSFGRWSWRERMQRKFMSQQFKVKDDDGVQVADGQKIITPLRLKDEGIAWFTELAQAGLVENPDQFKADSIYLRSGPNSLSCLLAVDFVNPLFNIDTLLQPRL